VPVLAELWSLLAVRRNAALATATCLDVAAHTDVLGVTTDDHEHALAVTRSWPDQSFSYTDATSFVLMAREGIDTVASLDDHFRVYRHGRRRARAFRVVG
jgi:predicted nucleic acid-binding protein